MDYLNGNITKTQLANKYGTRKWNEEIRIQDINEVIAWNSYVKTMIMTFQDTMDDTYRAFSHAYSPLVQLEFHAVPVDGKMFFFTTSRYFVALNFFMMNEFSQKTTKAVDDLVNKIAVVRENLKEFNKSLVMDNDFYR